MAKFNTKTTTTARRSVITTTGRAPTHQGGHGWTRDAKSELLLLAVANMVGQNTFYEQAGDRDARYADLVQQVAAEDPDWTAAFLPWLRSDANMRSASLVGALEAARAMVAAGIPGSRRIVDSVLQRADEPGEALAYWMSRYGRSIPMPVKRGVADAVLRMGTEFNYIKWGTSEARGYDFADILNLTHPGDARASRQQIRGEWQHDLFAYAVAKPYRDIEIPESLGVLTRREALMALPVDERRRVLEDPEMLRAAGITWEALAGWLQGPMDDAAWEAIIPSMGYMALLRNLRNFDQAGVSDQVAAKVAAKLADPEQVARSRQLPMRFLSAHRTAPSLRWSYPLEQALGHSLANITSLAGRTLILVDTSSSMRALFSEDGMLKRWDAAVLFGVALGQRCAQADVVSFSSAQYYYGDAPGAKTRTFPLEAGESLLRSLTRWTDGGWFLGGGTDTAGALRQKFNGHDRVVVVTDEQAGWSGEEVGQAIPANVPMYTWNLAGYRVGHAPSGLGMRHTFGGLTDAAFSMIPLLEAGRDAAWPWEHREAS